MILHTTYILERDEDEYELDIRYRLYRDGEIELEGVDFLGRPFDTSHEEDTAIIAHCGEQAAEDYFDREADEADYRYDLAQERKYFGE